MVTNPNIEWARLLEELGFYYPEPDFHPAWAHYEGMLRNPGKYTAEELETARIAAEKEGHRQFKKTKGSPT
jgi:hypothetical protein